MKRVRLLLAIVAGLFMGTIVVVNLRSVRFEPKTERDARFANVLEQQAVLKTGRKLIKAGDFERALEKFDEALSPKYIKSDFDKTQATSSKVDLYVLEGQFQKALEEHSWIFERTPNHQYSIAKRKEILALIEWEKTKDDKVIHDYVSFLKEHFREQIPPEGHKGYVNTIISTILRLYDTIGDHDAGIAYIDMILEWTFQDDDEFKHLRSKITNAAEATECAGLDIFPVTKRHPDWRACKWLREYLLVREAFEQDKAEGTKGRATKALIQSDHFPW